MSNASTRPQGPALARLLIMGPPGAGKGTQASSIARHFGIPAVSTGDIFRGLQTASTPLAERVRGIMAAGGYVDDETTNAIVADRLTASDCRDGFLLDGYPRTLGQVDTLDEILSTSGIEWMRSSVCRPTRTSWSSGCCAVGVSRAEPMTLSRQFASGSPSTRSKPLH